jgi:mannosyltransferase OCH1-like enzyme
MNTSDNYVGSMIDENKIIQGLWIGNELSIMEQLCVSSFLRNGHEFHLYVYDEPLNIPAGTTIKDGNEILPADRIFKYRDYPSYAGFSNFFRYKLLLDRGGWWADMDLVCIKPFDFAAPYVFSSEISKGEEVINCGAIKSPRGSPLMEYAWGVCQTKKPEELVWGETGPRLLGEAVRRYALEEFKKAYQTFCPIGYSDWETIITPAEIDLPEDVYAIHLWNEMWRHWGKDKNAQYPADCLYERLKKEYLVETPVDFR